MSTRWVELLITVVCAVIASSGFWAFLQARHDKKDARYKMLLGLGHEKIVSLSLKYIERGWITSDEFKDLNRYLYEPYKKMGGDGTAEKVMNEVRKLPIHGTSYIVERAENDEQQDV